MRGAKKIRLLVGDGRPLFRMGLRQLLAKEADISVVGEVESADQVVKKVTALKPQVLLLHSRLGESNGRSVLQQLQRGHPRVRVLILISNDKDADLIKGLRLPSAQIVPKQASFQQLIQWIRQLEEAGGRVDASIAGIPPPEAFAPAPWSSEEKDSSPLSARERQVVELVSQGFKNREIAQRMFISEQTVKNHLHNIFDKLGVSDRLELALYAIHKNMQPVE